jgi:hypothetical protein
MTSRTCSLGPTDAAAADGRADHSFSCEAGPAAGRTGFAVKAIRGGRQGGVGRADDRLCMGIGQLLLLLVDEGLEVLHLGVRAADGDFELVDVPLGIRGFQGVDAPAENTQILPYPRRSAFQGVRIDHEVRRHTLILHTLPRGDLTSQCAFRSRASLDSDDLLVLVHCPHPQSSVLASRGNAFAIWAPRHT